MRVKNFRGIKSLDWRPRSRLICLIGPGDSTKSTILDAIEYALSDRWNLSIVDADFYNQEVEQAIEIRITVGDLPEKLKALEHWGDHLRWMKDGQYTEEEASPEDAVATVLFRVTDSLEPEWYIQTRDEEMDRRASPKERAMLGALRLGSFVDRHLSWSRGSALARLTGDQEAIGATLAAANRSARDAVKSSDMEELKQAAKAVAMAASELGVKPDDEYQPGLDIRTLLDGSTNLGLHDGNVPARQKGLGTRRLLVAAVQGQKGAEHSVMLLDEVEFGLEPHRQKRLITSLRQKAEQHGQAIATTHSPYVLQPTTVAEVCVVRCESGTTAVQALDEPVHRFVREYPEALLARSIVVCEGTTELVLWETIMESSPASSVLPASYYGTAAVDGNGSEAPDRAKKLLRLGFRTALFADSDKNLGADLTDFKSNGGRVMSWEGGLATEERLALDLPFAAIKRAVAYVDELRGKSKVRQNLNSQTSGKLENLEEFWGKGEEDCRASFGRAAKASKWFKKHDDALFLAKLVNENLLDMADTPTHKLLDELRKWHEDA